MEATIKNGGNPEDFCTLISLSQFNGKMVGMIEYLIYNILRTLGKKRSVGISVLGLGGSFPPTFLVKAVLYSAFTGIGDTGGNTIIMLMGRDP